VLCSLGTLASEQGRYAEAIDAFERCSAIVVTTLGEKHPLRAGSLANIGKALADSGRLEEAVGRFEEAIAIDEETLPPDHVDRSYALLGLGTARLRLGRAAEAIEPLERTLALRASDAIGPSMRATAEVALARALWRSGRDRSRARTLAEAARRHRLDAGEPAPTVPLDDWLEQD
jgi:tetratricopeptide (TPR) repeat protein